MPPLKKVLSKNRYLRPHYNQLNTAEIDQQTQLASLGLHTEGEHIEISTEEIEIGPNEVIKTELNDFIIEEDANIKTEACDESEQLSDDEQDSDEGLHDSDFENDREKSKNNLPHKKRISRKLKNTQKNANARTLSHDEQNIQLVKINSYKCNKCSEFFPNANAFAIHKATHNIKKPSGVNQSSSFSCELCFKTFTNQWKFFEHLKSHYEPLELDTNSPKRTLPSGTKQNSNINEVIVKKELKNSGIKVRTLQNTTSLSPNAKIGSVSTFHFTIYVF